MSTLFDNFKKSLQSGQIVKSAKDRLLSSQPMLKALQDYTNLRDQEMNNYNGIIEAFTCTSDLITDKILEITGNTYQWTDDLSGNITEEVATNIIDTFKKLAQEVSAENTIYIDDSAYQFVYNNPACEVDGYFIDLSSCASPASIGDAIIYHDADGEYYINPIIRSSNFNFDVWQLVPRNSKDYSDDICFMLGENVADDIKTNVTTIINKLCENEPGWQGSINETLEYIVTELNLSGNTILDRLHSIWVLVKTTSVGIPQGTVCLLYDLLQNGIEAQCINDEFSKVSHMITNGETKFSDLSDLITASVTSKYQSVKDFYANLQSSYANGGITGVLSYLLSFGKALSTINVDDEERLTYTDNANLVPKQYLSGLVTGAVTALTTVVSSVITAINPVLGVATAIMGSLIGNLFSKGYDVYLTSTRAAVVNADKLKYDMQPVATFQQELIYNTVKLEFPRLAAAIDAYGICIVEVPFGYVIFGKRSELTVGMEFHPSVRNYTTLLQGISSSVVTDTDKLIYRPGLVTDQWTVIVGADFDSNALYNAYLEYENDNKILNVQQEGSSPALTVEDDKQMQLNAVYNTCLFACLYLVTRPTTDVRDYHVTIEYNPMQQKYSLTNDQNPHFLAFIATAVTWYYDGAHSGVGSAAESWVSVVNLFADYNCRTSSAAISYNPVMYSIMSLLEQGYYIGEFGRANSSDIPFYITIPEYDATTFWFWIGLGLAIATTSIAVGIFTTLKVRKFKAKQRALRAVEAEKAWDRFKANPTQANYESYFKEVRRNNIWSFLTGGTKYSNEGFWADTNSSGGAISSVLSKIQSLNDQSNTDTILSDYEPTQQDFVTLNAKVDTIYKLITGRDYSI